MKFICFFFIFIPLVYSEIHRFITSYTEINGQMTAGIPEFLAVTTLDGHQIDYYDSNIKKLIPKQDWMKEYASTDMWKEDTAIREHVQQIYRDNMPVIIQRFNQTHHGVHTYQRMYGCEYDDETGDSQVFDQYSYDGEDFISLDLKENRYIAYVPQGIPTAKKWNNDKTQLTSLKRYYDYDCVYWQKEFLHLSKATFKKADPKVSLLQKKPDSYVECHVTGFLFRNTIISWRKNGEALSDSSNLTSGDTLPNEDGTFQRRLTLYVLPDEWREDEYSCAVEHESLTETIQKILTEDQIKRNKSASDASYNIYLVIISVTVGLIVLLIVGLIVGLFVLWKHRMKLKAHSKKTTTYFKTILSPDYAPAQDSLLSTHSYKCSSPPEKFVSCE